MEEQNQIQEKNLLQKNKFYYFAIAINLLLPIAFVYLGVSLFIKCMQTSVGFLYYFLIALCFYISGGVLAFVSNIYKLVNHKKITNTKLYQLYKGDTIIELVLILVLVIIIFSGALNLFNWPFLLLFFIANIFSLVCSSCAWNDVRHILNPRIVKYGPLFPNYNTNSGLTKKRRFLQSGAIINIVIAFIGFVWLLVYTINAGKLMAEVYNYITLSYFLAYLIVTIWMFTLLIVSIILLIKFKKQEYQYPFGLVVTSMILGYFNPLSLAFLIVSLTKHSNTMAKILQGEIWFNSDEETFEYFKNKSNENIQKQISGTKGITKGTNSDDLFQSLIKLQKLQELKLINKNEFEAIKSKIIEKM